MFEGKNINATLPLIKQCFENLVNGNLCYIQCPIAHQFQSTLDFSAILYLRWKHLFLKSHLKCWPYCIVSVSLLFGNTLCFCASDIWNNWSILLFRNYLKRYLSFTLCWNILCFGISDIWLIWLIIVGIVFCPLWHTSMVL